MGSTNKNLKFHIVHNIELSVDPLTFDLLLLWVPSFLLFFVVLLFPIFRSLWLNLLWKIKMGVFSQNIVSFLFNWFPHFDKKSLFQNIFNKKNQFRLTPPYLKRKIGDFHPNEKISNFSLFIRVVQSQGIQKSKLSNSDFWPIRWQWCWWQRDVGDFMIVQDLRCWWHKHYVGDFSMHHIGHKHLQLVINIRHQHRCNRRKLWSSVRISKTHFSKFWPIFYR